MSPASPESRTTLLRLFAILRAIHWSHWTSHWKVKGDPQYGDHLLFGQLYGNMVEEIDDLGEKIVSYFGPLSQVDLQGMELSYEFLSRFPLNDEGPTELYERALAMEEQLQVELAGSYEDLKAASEMSLGLDDYLMSLANQHETHQYLLRQRLR